MHGWTTRCASVTEWPSALGYLRAREQVTMVYREVTTKLRLLKSGRVVQALAYAVDRNHQQYAGRKNLRELVDLARQGTGQSGKCTDYVLNTVAHLREMGIYDPELEAVAAKLEVSDR